MKVIQSFDFEIDLDWKEELKTWYTDWLLTRTFRVKIRIMGGEALTDSFLESSFCSFPIG